MTFCSSGHKTTLRSDLFSGDLRRHRDLPLPDEQQEAAGLPRLPNCRR